MLSKHTLKIRRKKGGLLSGFHANFTHHPFTLMLRKQLKVPWCKVLMSWFPLFLCREFLWSFRLPGEAQKIDRMMEGFAKRYCEQNPGVFTSPGKSTGYYMNMKIARFQVAACLSFKVSPDAQPFKWKWVAHSYANQTHFPFNSWAPLETHFKTELKCT